VATVSGVDRRPEWCATPPRSSDWHTRLMNEHTEPDLDHDDARDAAVAAYWATARKRAGLNRLDVVVGQQALGAVQPPAWSFGSDAEEADSLLELVLAGRKTATASAEGPYSSQGVPVPAPGDLSIILDGAGRPRALIVTTEVDVRPFREVDEEHAAAEGEGDLSLDHWRRVHEPFFTAELTEVGLPFDADAPVVLERFRLLDPKPRGHHEDVHAPVTT